MGRRVVSEPYYDASNHNRSSQVVERGYSQHERGSAVNCTVTKIRTKPDRRSSKPSNDEYANWKPFHKGTHSTGRALSTEPTAADGTGDPEPLLPTIEETDTPANTGEKRKRYVNSDDPNVTWQQEAVNYLHELFRFDGLGDALPHPCCSQCGAGYPLNDNDEPTRLFRCMDCNIMLQCQECCLESHVHRPLHVIQEYNGTYFRKITLAEMGLVYQLGHGGMPCDYPDPTIRKLTVLECNGIHQVPFRYCNCVLHSQPSHAQQLLRNGWYPATPIEPRSCATFACLDLFRSLNVTANVNARDFVTTLERLTDATGTQGVPDRYKSFGRMARQWCLLHRCKRSGVGFDIKSLSDVPPGSLAVLCWACPRENVNLPPKWDEPETKFSYLYMPILALDANFRLKNKLRANERYDPSLCPGSAYFLDSVPYKEHLKNYVSETDISTCVAFAALAEKDTKLATGLKTSGVGGCACARHELIRPLGIGDLQKGERYANMDYIFFSAILGIRLPRIGVSYDIVCQWKTTITSRLANLPAPLRPASEIAFTFGLPTWHAMVHARTCKASNALTYQEGVGRTDGEGIERIWSLLNPAGYATKEMGEGNRHDALDDRLDNHNFSKNLGLGQILSRRLNVALDERSKQVASFEFADKGLDSDPEKRSRWLSMITTWKLDHSQPNPYILPDSSEGPTEETVREKLKEIEEKEKEEGRTAIYGTSPSSFMGIGLQLEELQQSIQQDSLIVNRSATKELRLRERRETFLEMLENFRQLQSVYMPGAVQVADDEEDQCSPGINIVKLWLPSDFDSEDRKVACAPTIISIEGQLRSARCSDALTSLRQLLYTKKYLVAFRNANVTGQNDSTRARSLIDSVGERVHEAAVKYRRSRQALLNLGHPDIERFPELKDSDISVDEEDDPDLLAIVKLGNAGSKSRSKHHVSTGKKTISWVATGDGGAKDGSWEDECIRVEWSKALARKNRWTEEVNVLREEIRRVLRSLDWEEESWKRRMPDIAPGRLDLPATALLAGMRAYAARQAAMYRGISASFRRQWGHPSTK